MIARFFIERPVLANVIAVLTISYGGKSITALDLAPNLPEQFKKLYTEIESIAAQAAAAPKAPTP